MCSRNLAEGTPGTFECFTDDPEGISPHINTHPLPSDLEGWWSKLYLFKDGHFPDGDRLFYIDLDTLILGPLDEIGKYDGPFATLRDFFKPYDDVQSAVMAWPANTRQDIWDHWDELGRPILKGGDQELIQKALEKSEVKPDFFQDLFPNLFVSYKSGSFKRVPPKGASVVCFHGQPKPHNCGSTWVNGVWKIDGSRSFEIEQICNTEAKQIEENIRHSMTLDVPWLTPVAAHEKAAIIVGGAPSLKDTAHEIKARDGVVFATNNTAAYLQERGIAVDYHVLVDARPENVEFLTDEWPYLGYLIASQCDKSIFEKCEGVSVTLFHPKIAGILELVESDPRPVTIVGGGSTVCLKAMAIAYILGYRKFHLYGMDSSFAADGTHHAYEQAQNNDDLVINVEVDDQRFVTSPWMVAQADEFEDLMIELLRLGCDIKISGDGLIPYIVREMTAPLSVNQRAKEILARVPSGQAIVGAEIGVFAGQLSALLLKNPSVDLLMVDAWDSSVYGDNTEDFHATLSQEQQNAYMSVAIRDTDFAKDRRTILHITSEDAANAVVDGSLDFVFIDATHTYEGCKRDIELWYPKLKPGAMLSGHDYNHPDFPLWGVKNAVDEFAKSHGLSIDLGENFTWFTNKPLAIEMAA